MKKLNYFLFFDFIKKMKRNYEDDKFLLFGCKSKMEREEFFLMFFNL